MKLFRRTTSRVPSRLTCEDWVELVTAYVEGALSADAVRRIDRHLSKCEGCARYLDQMRSTIRVVGHLDADLLDREMPSELRAALLAEFREPRDESA